MSSSSVSLVLPHGRSEAVREASRAAIAKYLESTGFEFEILECQADGYGPSLRRAVADARGSVIIIVDPDLPYPVRTIGDAVAMIESSSTDIVFAMRTESHDTASFFLRQLLVPALPDRALQLKAFSMAAARLVVGESRLTDLRCDLEIAFLANKYGLRVENLVVETSQGWSPSPLYGRLAALTAASRIRWNERKNSYRPGRRCPVCFSTEVWTSAQVPGNLVRACSRCKCRFRGRFDDGDETHPVRRELRAYTPAQESDEPHSSTARERTSLR
ncbi:MAG: hypothetical protein ABI837_17925, partial [Acidobacteriota bacterium]